MVFELGNPKYQIVSTFYDTENKFFKKEWHTLKDGLVASLKENTKDVKVVINEYPKLQMSDRIPHSATINNQKLKNWIKMVNESELPTVLLDTDTLVLKDLYSIFEKDFDIAFTYRYGGAWMNGGVIFVKPTKEAKTFMKLWGEMDSKLYHSLQIGNFSPLKSLTKHEGLNQPSFVKLFLDSGITHVDVSHRKEFLVEGARIIRVPCKIWNNCDQTWHEFSEDTRILHVKAKLRQRAFGKQAKTYLTTKQFGKTYNIIKKYYSGIQ